MEDNIKQLTVLLTRLPETLVEKYYVSAETNVFYLTVILNMFLI